MGNLRWIWGLIVPSVAWLDVASALPQDTTVLINARLYPITGPVIEKGTMIVARGRIVGLGSGLRVPAGARVIDVEGKSVMPGIVESHSHVGLRQLWRPSARLENNELSGPINAGVNALDGIDVTDQGFRQALHAGVTTVNVTPGSRTPNGGQAVVLKLRGGSAEKMYLAHGGMKLAFRLPGWNRVAYPSARMAVTAVIREELITAQEYLARWRRYESSGQQGKAPARDLKLEALGKVLTREWVVGAHASYDHGPLEMLNAIRIAKEFNLDLFIHHGRYLVDVVEQVAAAGIPVSFGPVLPDFGRESRELLGPVRLVQLGGKVSFHSDSPDGSEPYLRAGAALFVRAGMSEADALRALTINPASLFRLQDRIGSLEPGKDADFVVLSDRPLEITSLVERVFIEGIEVYNRSSGLSVL